MNEKEAAGIRYLIFACFIFIIVGAGLAMLYQGRYWIPFASIVSYLLGILTVMGYGHWVNVKQRKGEGHWLKKETDRVTKRDLGNN